MHRGHRLRAFSSGGHSKWAGDQDTSWWQEGRAIPDGDEQLITGFSLCGTPITEFLTQMDAEKKKNHNRGLLLCFPCGQKSKVTPWQ